MNRDRATRTLNEEVGEEDVEAEEEPSGEHALVKINKTSNNRPQGLLRNALHLPPLLSSLAKSPLLSLFLTSLVRSTRTLPTPSLSGPTSKVTLMKAVDELVWANSQMLGCRGIFTVGLLQPLEFDVAVRGPKTG